MFLVLCLLLKQKWIVNILHLLSATPLETSSGTFNVWCFKKIIWYLAMLRRSLYQITTILCNVTYESLFEGKKFRFVVISLGRVVVPSPKTFPGSMRSFPVKENLIGSAVREILRYKHTNIFKGKLFSYFNIWY